MSHEDTETASQAPAFANRAVGLTVTTREVVRLPAATGGKYLDPTGCPSLSGSPVCRPPALGPLLALSSSGCAARQWDTHPNAPASGGRVGGNAR